MSIRNLVAGATALLALAGPIKAQSMPADVTGGADHPAISRFAGSWLAAQESRDFDQVTLFTGPDRSAGVEGRLTRLFYVSPAGKSVAEVQRNYELALEKAGAHRIDSCADGCPQRQLSRLVGDLTSKKLAKAELEGWSAETLLQMWLDGDSARYWYGTLKSGGTTLHVVVMSSKSDVIALSSKYVSTLLLVVEPKGMETGKVQVDAGAIARGLQGEGKVALYGIYFDTGKAEVKPESRPQLDEVAKMLRENAVVRVYVVGHTDNQGALESNLALSRARAQSVVESLVKNYKIDVRRLSAAGVASYAPVASNSTDAGRARNRRVEIVVQ